MKRRSRKSVVSMKRRLIKRPRRRPQEDSLENEMAACDAVEKLLRRKYGSSGLAPIPWWWP